MVEGSLLDVHRTGTALLVKSTNEGPAELLVWQCGRALRPLPCPDCRTLGSLRFADDGYRTLTLEDNRVLITSLSTRGEARWRTAIPMPVEGHAWALSERMAADTVAFAYDEAIHVWRVTEQGVQARRTVPAPLDRYTAFDLSSDGESAMVARGDEVRVHDGSAQRQFPIPLGTVGAYGVVNAAGDHFATFVADRVSIVDLAAQRVVSRSVARTIRAVAFTADGCELALFAGGKEVLLFDTATAQPAGRLELPDRPHGALRFAADALFVSVGEASERTLRVPLPGLR